MGIISSIISAGANYLGAKSDRKMQLKFAKKGLQWRTKDALAAGIHPLAAIGFNGPSYSPVYGNIGSSLEGVGQNIDRAVAAQMDAPERVATGRANDLALENAELQNKLLEAQIGDIHRSWLRPQAGSPPAMPGGGAVPLIAGQGDTRVVTEPTQYEAFEKLFGEGADIYGGAEGIRQAGSDRNWPVVSRYMKGVGLVALRRLLQEMPLGEAPEFILKKALSYSGSKRKSSSGAFPRFGGRR